MNRNKATFLFNIPSVIGFFPVVPLAKVLEKMFLYNQICMYL